MLFSLDELQASAAIVHSQMAATAQFSWPLLNQEMGCEVWVKHENHTPTGAFKVRGGITYMQGLLRERPDARGIVTATRGNHGQSQARAASAAGLVSKIVVPVGNASEKNAAMRAFGAQVIVHGEDFEAARARARQIAQDEGLVLVPPFHPDIVKGVASYALELMSAVPDLEALYVPIGCGSGICGCIAVRDALGLKTQIIGVVSTAADAARQSVEAGRIIETGSAQTFADGMAVRCPVPEAFEVYWAGAQRIVAVSDDEVADAMRLYFRTIHAVAEGAGAAPLAALMQERQVMAGRKVAVILCGGNVDSDVFAQVLAGQTPKP
jgi:threonine dehydratase